MPQPTYAVCLTTVICSLCQVMPSAERTCMVAVIRELTKNMRQATKNCLESMRQVTKDSLESTQPAITQSMTGHALNTMISLFNNRLLVHCKTHALVGLLLVHVQRIHAWEQQHVNVICTELQGMCNVQDVVPLPVDAENAYTMGFCQSACWYIIAVQ